MLFYVGFTDTASHFPYHSDQVLAEKWHRLHDEQTHADAVLYLHRLFVTYELAVNFHQLQLRPCWFAEPAIQVYSAFWGLRKRICSFNLAIRMALIDNNGYFPIEMRI